MTILEALERFGTRSDREPFDCEIRLHGIDVWAEAMVAAVNLAGYLDDAKTDEDLNDGVLHFKSLWSAEIVSHKQWTRETEAVMREVINAAQKA
jgi:hypothetical protein